MKDFYLEYRDSMGYVLMHLGKFKSYSLCRKAVNKYVNGTCMDNFYRDFKLQVKPLQILVSGLAIITPGSNRIKVKTLESSRIKHDRYHCKMTEFFQGSMGEKILKEFKIAA